MATPSKYPQAIRLQTSMFISKKSKQPFPLRCHGFAINTDPWRVDIKLTSVVNDCFAFRLFLKRMFGKRSASGRRHLPVVK
jgi:hypothetical protein